MTERLSLGDGAGRPSQSWAKRAAMAARDAAISVTNAATEPPPGAGVSAAIVSSSSSNGMSV